MSFKNFDEMLNNIKRITGARNQKEVAAALGISGSAITDAKNRNVIPETWFQIIEEKYGTTKKELCETPEEKLIRTYKGNLTKSVASQWNNEPGQLPESPRTRTEQDFSIEEMLADTKDVLESDTVYRQALASNIRAFKQAVINEGKMKNTDEKIDQMMRQIEALTTIVLQGQAPAEPEKKRAGNDH